MADQKGAPPQPVQPPPPPAYQPVPPGYGQPPQGQHTTTIVYQQPAPVLTFQNFRETPVRMRCPKCQNDVVSSISFETGTITWVACLVIALIGFWLGCCLIPFCINGCKDVVHTCPNCRSHLGRFNRM